MVAKGASSATTGPMPLPSGVASMHVLEAERAYDGTTLVLYEDPSAAPYATFFDGTAFSTPVALPSMSVSVHADAKRHLFAVDENNELWDGTSGTFVDRGVVPLSGGSPFPGPLSSASWAWTLSPAGVVATFYGIAGSVNADPSLSTQTFDASLAWSTPTTVTFSPIATDTFDGVSATSGADGSVHLIFAQSYEIGSTGETGAYLLYGRSPGTGSWQVLGVPDGMGVVSFAATSYAGAELLLSGVQEDPSGSGEDTIVAWATLLCAPKGSTYWQTVQLQEFEGYYPAQTSPLFAMNAAGYPSFRLWQASVFDVQTTF